MEPRYVITPCCKHKQSTKKSKGQIIKCTICKSGFVEITKK